MTFNGINRPWFTAIEADAEAKFGIPISGDSGTASRYRFPVGRVEISWNYQEPVQTLDVDLLSHKEVESQFESDLTAFVEGLKP
jgi:hypothetical protein